MIPGTARRPRPAAALLAGLVLSGWTGASCTPPAPPAPAAAPPPALAVSSAACVAVDGSLPADVRADALAGEFRLTLAATRGPRAGRSASGTLALRPFGSRPVPVPAAEGTRHPLFGGTDADLAGVGAVAPGSASSADAEMPGVLVLEWRRPDAPADRREITLRLGADANHGDRLRFDGAYTALTVTSLSADGFGGTWESGGGDAQAGGHFCAERAAARG